ncbi:MAG: hypothetical protein DDT18_01547 [Actinobacteria bacterium]|uniref:Transposase n=4 Tax=Candidatus Hakubella thermalkaliphila TaxID=2754717 RepID=A0A6V8QCA8_9ACTN|nr:hypothetical protein [Actinomycetota bacterium]GFP29491.1 hypothetical protein HKBW3S34_00411 [Candidatus Hakubella thermalkaliphila]GFP42050.1 hypothetical protein HKBW3C_01176 [Candidatus Hakubella thermalkaliphila]
MITVKLQLYKPTKCKEQRLFSIIREFTSCANWYLDKLQESRTTSRVKIHNGYYETARKSFRLLSANVQLALDKAIETQRAFLNKKGKKSVPKFKKQFACFRQDTFKIFDRYVQFNMPGRERVNIPFKVCNPNHKQFIKQQPKRSQLINKKGKWFLYVSYETDKPAIDGNINIIGVDLGVKKIVTVSNPEASVNVFFSGNKAIYTRNKYQRYRKQIQRAKDTGKAKRGYRALKRISGKEKNWIKDTNHKISKQIVNIAKQNKADIAIENLKGIRERIKATKKVRRMLHSWSFRQLISFLQYKSAMAGVRIVSVDPRHTSQRCPRCGHISKDNRKSQSAFKCSQCHYSVNADLVGSRNIALTALNLYGEGKRPSERAVMLLPMAEGKTLMASCLEAPSVRAG